jgi:hypothetical protein
LIKKTACERMAWFQLAHDTVKYAMAMDFHVLLKKTGALLTSCAVISLLSVISYLLSVATCN